MSDELSFNDAMYLNCKIASKVFRWQYRDHGDDGYDDIAGPGFYIGNVFVSSKYNLPHWSTDIVDAWNLVQRLERDGWVWSISTMRDGERGIFVRVEFPLYPAHSVCERVEAKAPVGRLPEAICKAAIKAGEMIIAYSSKK
ncbi:MAG: hypothetical protein QXU32_02110 [Nitrososphaerales archaeon]